MSNSSETSSNSEQPQSPPSKGSLLVVFLTVFIDLLGFGMVLPLLPLYARHLTDGMTPAEQGWTIGLLMASFSAMQFLFSPAWGRLSDSIGRRPVLILGLTGSTFFYALLAFATWHHSLIGLFVARIGAGIAGATIPTAQAYIADTTTLQGRAKGMALIGAAFGLGFTLGPLIGAAGLVVSAEEQLSPLPGVIASVLSAIALGLAIFILPESLRRHANTTHRAPPTRRKIFDAQALVAALKVPSIGLVLLTMFVSVFSFANFESTIALLLGEGQAQGGFDFKASQVLLVFAFVGLVLTLAQGFLVRRLADRVNEGTLATSGAITSLIGFVLLALASNTGSTPLLFFAMSVEVVGFALMTPSLNSMLSRRSSPETQGRILGVSQSFSSLARILGPLAGIRLFKTQSTLPFWSATVLMAFAAVLVIIAAKRGRDYVAEEPGSAEVS